MNIAGKLTDLIGNTPLLRLNQLLPDRNVMVKLECFNPLSSAKDRVALYMLDKAEQSGKLKPGDLIVEPTSGNTGVGLAYIAAQRGYRLILTMPDTMSAERRTLLSALGAELVLTDGSKGMQGAVEKANELSATYGAFIPGQFENPNNALAHYETTGPEIWRDTDGTVDIFVACVGTGGTITGVGRYLKEQKPSIQIVAVEPAESPLLSAGKTGSHKIQGIGANFVPKILDRSILDEIVTVTSDEAFQTARQLATTEGVLVGISSGAALAAAIQLSQRPDNRDKSIVVLFPDTGERYLSTELFQKI